MKHASFVNRLPLLLLMSALAAGLYGAFRALGGAADMSIAPAKKESATPSQ